MLTTILILLLSVLTAVYFFQSRSIQPVLPRIILSILLAILLFFGLELLNPSLEELSTFGRVHTLSISERLSIELPGMVRVLSVFVIIIALLGFISKFAKGMLGKS